MRLSRSVGQSAVCFITHPRGENNFSDAVSNSEMVAAPPETAGGGFGAYPGTDLAADY